MPETPAFRYNFVFAARVWEIFKSQHALAVSVLFELYPRIPKNFPARLIAQASPRWYTFKQTVRFLEKFPKDTQKAELRHAVDKFTAEHKKNVYVTGPEHAREHFKP